MKKVLLALFLIFSFASSAYADNHTTFSVIDEEGAKQEDAVSELSLDITKNGTKRYKIKATNLSSDTTIMFKNNSLKNIILRFDAGSTSKGQNDATSKKQIVYQVGFQNDFSTSDYHAFSSCEVDKNTDNRPTGSFIIINGGQTKYLRFALRDCDTGEIKKDEKVNLETTLSIVETELRDTSVDHKIAKTHGLPTVIIGQEVTRDLSIRSAKTGKDEFVCRTANNINSLELYDGSNKKVDSFSYKKQDGLGAKINFTIKNEKDINYRRMHIKLTCKQSIIQDGVVSSIGRDSTFERRYYFDARPKEIRVKNLPNADEWLYAEQRYGMDGKPDENRFNEFIEKAKTHKDFFLLTNTEKKLFDEVGQEVFLSTSAGQNCENCEIKVIESKIESKEMKPITLTAVDAAGKEIESYSSIAEIAITGKIYSDGSKGNIINEKSGDNLIRPCVAGSRANCEIALAEIKKDKTEIYTHIINNKKLLAYNNVGPTVLYGADTEWTKYSQTYKAPDSAPTTRQANQANQSTLCNKFESHSGERRVTINGKDYNLVGCNIPFVPENGKEGDEINFYSFKPAFYKLTFDNKNSPANDSYGTDKLTYIHTIVPGDYNAEKKEIFEAADFNPSVLAIGATLESLRYNRALSHYDNNLKVAKKLIFSGNPANPTITIEGQEQNNIAVDFKVTAKNNNKTDISDAILLTLEPKNPYNHEEGYTGATESKDITTNKDSITLNMPANNFYAGKNIKVNKLNFKREDLLARSYAHIGKSTLNIDIGDTNNAGLKDKITKDEAALIFSYKGDDLHFVDAAIIAPNVASNDNTADGAAYLAGYCDPANHEECKKSGIFITDTIAGHMNYFGFDFLVYGKKDKDKVIKESSTDKLFDYDQATFSQFKRGADFLRFGGNEVKIQLQGDKTKEYCSIFRNCYPLGSNFGTTFNSYKTGASRWHGSGDQPGDTIVDGGPRRKEQRLNF